MTYGTKMPDFEIIPSSFGGGWVMPLTYEARDTYARQFGCAPYPLLPVDGAMGWIVEPRDWQATLADIRADGFVLA